jgi:DNA-binding transcriptional ArsR family regulator
MTGKNYLVKEIDGQLYYDRVHILKNPSSLKLIDHAIRQKILRLLSKEPMYPAQIAKALNLHEQKVYYHIKQLINADVLEITERKEIRGTTAKKYRPKDLNFAVSLTFHGKSIRNLSDELREPKLDQFLKDFIVDERLNAKIVVGSPDPHGPYKARARDGHYAIDLALFLGSVCTPSKDFATKLDVDVDLRKCEDNLIIVGGPVTNLTMAKANEFLPVKFSEAKPWGISGKKTYTDDNIGLIANIPNPYNPHFRILAFAGIRFSGTKAAVLAFTRFTSLILTHYSGQREFSCIMQGFDLDGDGKVDSIELLE